MTILNKFFEKVATPLYKEFPFFFIVLTLIGYPIIVDFLANLPAVGSVVKMSRYLGMAIFIAYLFTVIVYCSQVKIVKMVFYTILSALALTDIFLRLAFGQQISPVILLLLGETNSNESTEFINTFVLGEDGFLAAAILTIVVAATIVLEKNRDGLERRLKAWGKPTKAIAALFLAYFLIAGAWKARIYYTLLTSPTRMQLEEWATSNKSGTCTDLVTCTSYALTGAKALANDIQIAKQTALNVCKSHATIAEDSTLTVVYVLGESFIKYHSSLYGYYNKTNPRLEKEQKDGNLFVFNDVVTPYNRTSFTMKNTFSCNSLSNRECWAYYPLFPTIFKQAGYDVYFWDIQKTMDTKEMYSISINSLLYDRKIQRLSYSELSSCKPFAYDGQLVADFFSKPRAAKGRNLVMFHLLGQHVDADKRYPHTAEFTKFQAKDIRNNNDYITEKMKSEIAHYDNATLYNDYVVSEIIRHYKDKNCVLVYYSDHGEEIYDYRPSLGRKLKPMCSNLLKYQFDIPFMVWCSDTYKQRHPDIIKRMRAAVNKPLTIDHIAHTLLALGGIRTPYYRKRFDILNPSYQPGPRIVNDNIEYEKTRWGRQ